jgi:hypothetical protein
MDETFAAALRAALVEHVETSLAPARARRRRRRVIVLALAGLALAGGGVAVAAQLLAPSLPGSDVVTAVAPAVVVSGAGTQTVELGPPPAGASRIDIQLTCLTAGTFGTADGASLACTDADVGGISATMLWGLPVTAGQHSTTITAASGTRWRLVAAYSSVHTTAWGVNARGQTYGVVNSHGTPDLIAVIATNGKTGYAYGAQLFHVQPNYTSPADAVAGQNNQQQFTVPVYESDGQTVIGEFVSH